MKKYLYDFLLFTILLIFFIYIIFNNDLISNIVIDSFYMWLRKVVPTVLPTIVIVDLFFSSNIPYLINKYFKINPLYLLCIISGSPTNGYILSKYDCDITKHLSVTKCCGLIFTWVSLNKIFDNKTSFLLIIFNILSNIILIIFLKPIKINLKRNNSKFIDLFVQSVKNGMIVLLSILGFIIFFNIIPINLISNIFIKGLLYSILEITTFFDYLSVANVCYELKIFFSIIALSSCGLCISLQTKSIISDTSYNYMLYFKYRLIHLIIFLSLGIFLIF